MTLNLQNAAPLLEWEEQPAPQALPSLWRLRFRCVQLFFTGFVCGILGFLSLTAAAMIAYGLFHGFYLNTGFTASPFDEALFTLVMSLCMTMLNSNIAYEFFGDFRKSLAELSLTKTARDLASF